MNFNEIAEQSKASIEKEDLKVLLPIVERIEPKKILEIGTWKGYSAETWIKAFNPSSFVTLEIESKEKLGAISNPEYNYWFEVNSHDLAVWSDVKIYLPSIDFMFIDGDHSLKGVKDDFNMYAGLVKKGGIIAFHDVCYHADKTEEVDILWNEIKLKYPYVEIKVGKNSTGIGVIWV